MRDLGKIKILLLSFPSPEGPISFYKGNCILRERKQTFWSLLDTGSELRLILGDLKKHCSPPEEAYRGELINRVLTEVQITEVPVGPQTHPVVVSSAPEYIIDVDIIELVRILTLVS